MLKQNSKYLKLFLLFNICVALTIPSIAFSSEWTDEKYTHFSKNEPLADMLEAMALNQNLSIVVSGSITETISAYYKDKKSSEIFNSIVNTYGLVTYFDGDALYIYKIDEIKNATISLTKSPISFLEKELIDMGALNSTIKKEVKWNVHARKNRVSFRGVQRFIEIVNNIADTLNNNDYVFRWTSKDGIVHYSNEPPFGNSNYKRVTSISSSVVQTEENDPYIKSDAAIINQKISSTSKELARPKNYDVNLELDESHVIDRKNNSTANESDTPLDHRSSTITILR